jgi:hypothetical protein
LLRRSFREPRKFLIESLGGQDSINVIIEHRNTTKNLFPNALPETARIRVIMSNDGIVFEPNIHIVERVDIEGIENIQTLDNLDRY